MRDVVWPCCVTAMVVWGCGCGGAPTETPAALAAAADEEDGCGAREVVEVHDAQGLRAAIGRDHIDLRLAPGRFALAGCPPGVSEWDGADCGQLLQGDCSILSSGLRLARDGHGVPAASGVVVPDCAVIPTDGRDDGAVIDCGALPPSDLEFSCLVAGDRSTVRNLTVCNGPVPVPLGPGESGVHRNGIIILADHAATVEWVRVVNARRGALMTGLSGHESRGVIRHSLIEATELAGIFLWAREPDGDATHDARLSAEVESNHIIRAGLHPLLAVWSYGGNDNETRASFIDNVVEAPSVYGLTVQGVGAQAEGNQVWFELRGGRLDGGRGVYVAGLNPGASYNQLRGEVTHVTMSHGVPALGFEFQGTGNEISLGFDHNRYVGDTPGLVEIDLAEGNALTLDGSAHGFATRNHNFDGSAAAPYFER